MQETMSNKSRVGTRKEEPMTNTARRIKTFIGAIMLAALSAVAYATSVSHALHSYFALAVLALAVVTSRMKVKLPGINGNMSVNLPFLLTAVVNLSATEAILITCVSTTVQCWPRKNSKFNAQQMAFNISMMAFATCMASLLFHAEWIRRMPWSSTTLDLVLATATLFLGQTAPVAAIIALSEGKAAGQIWRSLVQLSFPYYVVSAGVTSMVETVSSHLGWQLALAVFPVMYAIHRSYKVYFGKTVETPRSEVLVRAASAGA
jgi:hypothetical protein